MRRKHLLSYILPVLVSFQLALHYTCVIQIQYYHFHPALKITFQQEIKKIHFCEESQWQPNNASTQHSIRNQHTTRNSETNTSLSILIEYRSEPVNINYILQRILQRTRNLQTNTSLLILIEYCNEHFSEESQWQVNNASTQQ